MSDIATRDEIVEQFGDEDLLFLEPPSFDSAIVGVSAQAPSRVSVVVYDREEVIDILMDEEMSREEAEEYFEFNISGVWMGDRTPIFLMRTEQ